MGLFSTIVGGIGGFLVGGPAGAVAGAKIGSAIGGSKKSGSNLTKAVNAAVEGQQGLIDEASAQKGVVEEDFAPFVAPGKEASNTLLRLLQGDKTAFERSPGFNFIRDEALGAVNRDASAAGLLNSGNRLKALTDRAANLASTDFGNFFNRLLNTAQQGQGAVTNKSAFATSLSSQAGQGKANVGQIRASGFLGKTKNFNNLLASLTGAVGDFVDSGASKKSLLSKLLGTKEAVEDGSLLSSGLPLPSFLKRGSPLLFPGGG